MFRRPRWPKTSGILKFTITTFLPDHTNVWWHNPRHYSSICYGLWRRCQLNKRDSLSYLWCQKTPCHDRDPDNFSFSCHFAESGAYTYRRWNFLLPLPDVCSIDGHLERLLCGVVSYFFEVSLTKNLYILHYMFAKPKYHNSQHKLNITSYSQ